MRTRRRELQALEIVSRCDTTSTTLARITGMPAKTASSVLCKLYQLGAVSREAYGRDVTGRPPYLYSIKRAA
jgi:DNA-binding IclR family transcriptional regulator